MKIDQVCLENIKNFKNGHVLDFSGSTFLNTVSGKNGSGKSTVFECISVCQKAYFISTQLPRNNDSLQNTSSYQLLAKELTNLCSSTPASISLTLSFTSEELAFFTEASATTYVTLTVHIISPSKMCETLKWSLDIGPYQNDILQHFWNLQNPSNLIVLLDSDKMVDERDFTFQDINMVDQNHYGILEFILDPRQTYQHLYTIMLNTYVYSRLVPRHPRSDQFTADSKNMFHDIMEGFDLQISNVSGQVKDGQFILLARQHGKYDMRQMSSGEKLVWYTCLLLNYVKSIGILIIDEPENHLHEQLLWSFVCFLERLQHNNIYNISIGQIFLPTHAKNLIYNNFTHGTNYLITDTQEVVSIDRTSCEEQLRNLGISYVEDKVLFVEGTTEIGLLRDLCAQNNIKLHELPNCSEIVRTYKSLLNVPELVYVPKFVFLTDKDTQDDEYLAELRNQNPDFYDKHFSVLPVHEIENLFLDEELIANASNALKHITNPHDVDIINAADIRTILRRHADEELLHISVERCADFASSGVTVSDQRCTLFGSAVSL